MIAWLLVPAAGALLAGCAVTAHRMGDRLPSTGAVRAASAGPPVLRDGQTVHGSGTVLAVPGRPVRFCAPVPVPAVGYLHATEPAPPCDIGVDVTGVHIAALTDRRDDHGTISGLAALTGTYRYGSVTVTRQAPPDPAPGPARDRVPCPTPPGGWPHGPANENLDLAEFDGYVKAHPGSIVFEAELRPSATQVVRYALTAGDPAPVLAALRPGSDGRLCVQRSRYTGAQKDAAQRAFDPSSPRNARAGVWGVGHGLSRDGQEVIGVHLAYVTAELAARAAAFPTGLVEFDPWLVSVG